jgi:hypothetical protein
MTIVSVFILSLCGGYGTPGAACAILHGEISSVFLAYKDMFTKETRNSTLGQLNQLAFFITFTIFRASFFPFLVYKTIVGIILAIKVVSVFQAFCMVYCVFFGSVIVVLNLYWYVFMIKGAKRML